MKTLMLVLVPMEFNLFTKKYFLLVISVAIFCWALAFPSIRFLLDEGLSPINLTIMRIFITCISFVIIISLKKNYISIPQKRDIPYIIILGLINAVVYHLALNYGEQFVSPSVASLIIIMVPIFVIILSMVFLKERMTQEIILGVFLAIFGTVIITFIGTQNLILKVTYFAGVFAIFLAAISAAFYSILGKRLLEKYNTLSILSFSFLFGSFGLMPFFDNSIFSELLNLSIIGWITLLSLGIFSTVLAYFLWFTALEIKRVSEVAVYIYFIPFLSTIISYFLLHEKITLWFVVGGAFIILGVTIVDRHRNKS